MTKHQLTTFIYFITSSFIGSKYKLIHVCLRKVNVGYQPSIKILLLMPFIMLGIQSTYALDLIKMSSPLSANDTRINYKNEVLTLALEATKEEYGAYWLSLDAAPPMHRQRVIKTLEMGELINVYISPANSSWQDRSIEIAIPIRGGITGYRLLVTHKDDLILFKNIDSLDALKKLKVGTIQEESFSKVLKHHGLNVLFTNNYEGSFQMLSNRRFKWMSRGVHEIFDELHAYGSESDIKIVPGLMLYSVLPTYIYVSKSHPRLAERLIKGLTRIDENGQLSALFDKYYADDIKKAELHTRKVIAIDNPYIENKKAIEHSKFWFSMDDYQKPDM